MGTGWLLFEEARELLVDRLLVNYDAVSAAYDLVEQDILERLVSTGLPSRPQDPDKFRFEFICDQGNATIPLTSDGTIPGTFWIFYSEAIESSKAGTDGKSLAERLRNSFRFRQSHGIRDGGTLEGLAPNVELLRAKLPALPALRGRPTGPKYDDGKIVELTIAELEKQVAQGLEVERDKVIKKFAPMLSGASRKAREKRLRERLKEVASWEKYSR